MDYEALARRIPPGLMPGWSDEELVQLLRSGFVMTVEFKDQNGQPVQFTGTAAEFVEKYVSP